MPKAKISKLPMLAAVAMLGLPVLLGAPCSAAKKPAGVYEVQSSKKPTTSGGVDQSLANQIPAYSAESGSSWWFCGHAAVASAMNYLRQSSVTRHQKITQLQWFHERLSVKQPGYRSDPHRQASMDTLNAIVRSEKGDEFSIRKVTGYGSRGRASVRDQMLETLERYSAYAIVLSSTTINGKKYGHFYTVYKIDYRPNSPTGGTAFFWDPYRARLGSMPFSELMDGMRDFGTRNRYSFLRLYKN